MIDTVDEVRFTELCRKRFIMERSCVDADAWQRLADEFRLVGALANAERCEELARHFAAFVLDE